MKFLSKLFVFLIIVLLVIVIGRNAIVKAAVENGVSLVTGLQLHMKSIKVGLLSTDLVIKELKILNPKGFEEKTMLDMPEITVDYKLADILKGKIHLENIVIDLKEFNVVRNGAGKLNLDSLKMAQEGQAKKEEPAAKPAEKKKTPPPKLQIDNLQLRVGKIAFKDFSKTPPGNNEFEFNLNENHQNITNPQVLVAIIVQKALMKASIAKISGFELGDLQGVLSGTLGGASDLAMGALGTAKDAIGNISSAASQINLEKMKNMGSESASALKSLGIGSMNTIKNVGEGAGSTATTATKDAFSSLKGLAGKLPTLSGSSDQNTNQTN